ncbi:MAG: hypothetical protein ACI9H8_002225 [Lysobacterales bacterium]
MSNHFKIRVNPTAVIERLPINDQFFAIVVDDFLLNPEEVVEYANSHRADFEKPQRGYPGEVLDLEPQSLELLFQFWRTGLSRIFSFARSEIEDSCQISLTTLLPEDFSWIQRLPHTDHRRDPGKENIALLVYLFDNPELGGTGFYRYRDEKFWQSVSRKQINDPHGGLSIVETRYPMFRDPPKYPGESDQAVELITRVEAKFNRMVCYSGDVPHSAMIPDASLLADDCLTGRLTLNAFASVWPKKN